MINVGFVRSSLPLNRKLWQFSEAVFRKSLQNLVEQRVQGHEDYGRTLQTIGIFSSEVFQILGKDLQGLWKKSQKNSQLLQPN